MLRAAVFSALASLAAAMGRLDLLSKGIVALAAAAVLAGFAVFLLRRARRERHDRDALADAIRDNVHLPPSLHPVIDPDICIGSLSCVSACPEGDILGVVDGVAKLIVGSSCIGHGRCAVECPVHAIRLVVGTSERGVDLPEVDSDFQSSRRGVYIVGELGGMGLIKNAIRQGLQVAEQLGRELGGARRRGAGGAPGEVLIVGAGPAGLATALGLRAAGVPFRLVDQDRFGGTIAHYPRHKVVMTERVTLPLWGKFGKALISKEELLDTWDRIARKVDIRVEEGVRVEDIVGEDRAFRVRTSGGEVIASKVVLAIGRRGTPRTLGVPGEAMPKVCYHLDDPEQYAGRRVLVVGGGDSAIEAACQLAETGQVEVAISYRQGAFSRCRQANRQRIEELIAQGEVHAFLGSQVTRVEARAVHLTTSEGRAIALPNDYVIACLGGELPASFLDKAQISLVRHRGDRTIPHVAQVHERHRDAGWRRAEYLPLALALVGAAILTTLTLVGLDYYLLDRAARARAPMHELLRSSGPWGHGVGLAATLFMLSNFLYPLRKRVFAFKGSAPIKSWLTFHVFVGIMSPLVIAFHAAFQSRNQLATATYVSLLVVVATGLVGRYVYGLIPTDYGKASALERVRTQLARERRHVENLLEGSYSPVELRALFDHALTPTEKRGSMLLHLLFEPLNAISAHLAARRVRDLFPSESAYYMFRRAYLALRRLQTQVSFYNKLKRFLSIWRALHVVLAISLVVIIAFHVGVSLYLGYKWIF